MNISICHVSLSSNLRSLSYRFISQRWLRVDGATVGPKLGLAIKTG